MKFDVFLIKETATGHWVTGRHYIYDTPLINGVGCSNKNPMVINELWLAESYIEDWGENKFEIVNATIQTAEELEKVENEQK